MARTFIEGVDAPAPDLRVWDRLHREFHDAPDEHRAAQVLCRFTGGTPLLHDKDGKQRAVDILLALPTGSRAVVEVSSTFDPILRRDMHNSDRFEADIASRYAGTDRWVLHLQPGWDVPPAKHRRILADAVARELEQRDPGLPYGSLGSAHWIFAWRDASAPGGVDIRGWDSRVPRSQISAAEELTSFLDGTAMRNKREKLIADARSVKARHRHLYLLTTPTGKNAHIGTASTWELSDGSFQLPADLDELWLDGLNGLVRRFDPVTGYWTEYSV